MQSYFSFPFETYWIFSFLYHHSICCRMKLSFIAASWWIIFPLSVIIIIHERKKFIFREKNIDFFYVILSNFLHYFLSWVFESICVSYVCIIFFFHSRSFGIFFFLNCYDIPTEKRFLTKKNSKNSRKNFNIFFPLKLAQYNMPYI